MRSSPNRKRPAHPSPVNRHNQPVVLFVTACTKAKARVLACDEVFHAIQRVWSTTREWRVAEFVLMPEHVHMFCVPGVHHPESINVWTRYWKRALGDEIAGLRGRWLRDAWDTQMRDADHFREKLHYMRENPVRRGLVSSADEWKYRGELHAVRW